MTQEELKALFEYTMSEDEKNKIDEIKKLFPTLDLDENSDYILLVDHELILHADGVDFVSYTYIDLRLIFNKELGYAIVQKTYDKVFGTESAIKNLDFFDKYTMIANFKVDDKEDLIKEIKKRFL